MRRHPIRSTLLLSPVLWLLTLSCADPSPVALVDTDSISHTPLPVSGGLSATDLAVGFHYACAATESGAWCWGLFSHQVQGSQLQADMPAPVALAGGTSLTQVAASYELACGLDASGAASCWGDNGFGQLGVADPSVLVSSSARAVETAQRFFRVAAGSYQACGLTPQGAVYCWGNGGALGAGDGLASSNPVPVRVASDRTFTQIAAGQAHTCALDDTGTAWCWGKNDQGQVGNGVLAGESGAPFWVTTPQQVAGGHHFVSIAAGGFHSCGVTDIGEAWCWGANFDGQLGNGAGGGQGADAEPTPVRVSGTHIFNSLVGGYTHTCGMTTDGSAWCWGGDYTGALGSQPTQSCAGSSRSLVDACSRQPAAVSSGLLFARLAAGWGETCGVTREGNSYSGKAYCWGLRRALGSAQ